MGWPGAKMGVLAEGVEWGLPCDPRVCGWVAAPVAHLPLQRLLQPPGLVPPDQAVQREAPFGAHPALAAYAGPPRRVMASGAPPAEPSGGEEGQPRPGPAPPPPRPAP